MNLHVHTQDSSTFITPIEYKGMIINTYTYKYVCICLCLYIYVYICMYVYMFVCLYRYIDIIANMTMDMLFKSLESGLESQDP